MKRWILSFALLASTISNAAPDFKQQAEQFRSDVEAGKMLDRAMTAIETALIVGSDKLRENGYDNEAEMIMSDWFDREAFNTRYLLTTKTIGDHAPIQWLYDVWEKMDELLGSKLMMYMHTDDLHVFSLATKPCVMCQDNISEADYYLHFVGDDPSPKVDQRSGFAGSTAYWISMAACSASMSAPWSMLCSPVAGLVERAVYEWVAPPLSPKAWKLVCK